MGQSYYGIVVSTISAIVLIKLAFDIDILLVIMMFPMFLLFAFIIGLYLDRKNINTMDQLKSMEMSHRFLNTADIKSQEFQLIQTEMILQGLKAIQEGKPFDILELHKKFEEYRNKWSYHQV